MSDDSVVRLASDSRQGRKFKSLWNGEIPEGKSHSDADMSLASILAFWCGGDVEQMDRLFRKSGLMRSKWDRVQSGSTYGALTLEKAVAQAVEFYRGGDVEQMDRLFRKSGLMRSKWDRVQSGSTYGALTLEKAVAQAVEFYRPYATTSAESDFDDMLQKLVEWNVSDNRRYPWNDNGSGRLFADVYKDMTSQGMCQKEKSGMCMTEHGGFQILAD